MPDCENCQTRSHEAIDTFITKWVDSFDKGQDNLWKEMKEHRDSLQQLAINTECLPRIAEEIKTQGGRITDLERENLIRKGAQQHHEFYNKQIDRQAASRSRRAGIAGVVVGSILVPVGQFFVGLIKGNW
jgi:hypothetical protein